MAGPSIDHRIIQTATRQNGAVSRADLYNLGLSASIIDLRLRTGLLHRVLAGYYVVPLVANEISPACAILLAHPDAALARATAGRRHGFALPGRGVQVVVAHGAHVRAVGVRVHETRWLPEVDVERIDGVRATSAARTICDLAPGMSDEKLVHLIETQLTRRRPEPDDLLGCLEVRRRRRVRGMIRLGSLLADLIDDEPYPQSKFEIELFDGLKDLGLGGLRRQFRPPWYEGRRGIVDGADPAGRTIIEADGRRYRQVTAAHENDRRRDRLAAANGWLTIRVGWRELQRDRDGTLHEIVDIVLARRAGAA